MEEATEETMEVEMEDIMVRGAGDLLSRSNISRDSSSSSSRDSKSSSKNSNSNIRDSNNNIRDSNNNSNEMIVAVTRLSARMTFRITPTSVSPTVLAHRPMTPPGVPPRRSAQVGRWEIREMRAVEGGKMDRVRVRLRVPGVLRLFGFAAAVLVDKAVCLVDTRLCATDVVCFALVASGADEISCAVNVFSYILCASLSHIRAGR